MAMTAVTILDTDIRRDAQGRFCLNDLHRAAGGSMTTPAIAANLRNVTAPILLMPKGLKLRAAEPCALRAGECVFMRIDTSYPHELTPQKLTPAIVVWRDDGSRGVVTTAVVVPWWASEHGSGDLGDVYMSDDQVRAFLVLRDRDGMPMQEREQFPPASAATERQSHTDGPSAQAASGGHPNCSTDSGIDPAREQRVARAVRNSEARLALAVSLSPTPAASAQASGPEAGALQPRRAGQPPQCPPAGRPPALADGERAGCTANPEACPGPVTGGSAPAA